MSAAPDGRAAQTGVIGVVVHPGGLAHGSLAILQEWMAARRLPLVAREGDRRILGAHPAGADGPGAAAHGADGAGSLRVVRDTAFTAVVQAVVALGGDVAVRAALRALAAHPVPVLGVHDDPGLLTAARPDELDRALTLLVGGLFTVEAHHGLRLQRDGAPGAGLLVPSVVFDDAVLTGGGDGLVADLEVNGQRVGSYDCEAVVVATSTGSTAASYAAGGPVLSPSLVGTVITPVGPASGIARPVVIAAADVVRLRLPSPRAADVVVDGAPAGAVSPGEAVVVRPLLAPGQVVRLHPGTRDQRDRVRPGLLNLPLRRDQLHEVVPLGLRRSAH